MLKNKVYLWFNQIVNRIKEILVCFWNSKEVTEYYEALQNGGDTVVHEKHNSRYEYYYGVEYKDNVFNMINYTKKDEEGNTVEYFCYATNLRISE